MINEPDLLSLFCMDDDNAPKVEDTEERWRGRVLLWGEEGKEEKGLRGCFSKNPMETGTFEHLKLTIWNLNFKLRFN